MGTEYSQLDLDERIEVFRLNLEARSYREIGRMMGRHHTTIMREVRRNSLKSGYKPGLADHIAWVRRKRALKPAPHAFVIRRSSALCRTADTRGGYQCLRKQRNADCLSSIGVIRTRPTGCCSAVKAIRTGAGS